MTPGRDHDDMLSPAALEDLLHLLVTSSAQRVSSARLDGQRVFIKRYDVALVPPAKRLHALLSPLAFHPFLRSSAILSPAGTVEREARKMDAFRRGGFETPTIIYRSGPVMIMRHVDSVLKSRLRELASSDPAAHDDLLVECARTLAHAHVAGLCHGRPHVRDMFMGKSGIGFLDFEEEPEMTMPLDVAQARDIWLLLHHICGNALSAETAERAFIAYRAAAPASAVVELLRARRKLAPFIKTIALAERILPLGTDGRRLAATERVLRASLGDPTSNSEAEFIVPHQTSIGRSAHE
jgi:tRNA A-37 threonylcarbamoyl transferase component Bud32